MIFLLALNINNNAEKCRPQKIVADPPKPIMLNILHSILPFLEQSLPRALMEYSERFNKINRAVSKSCPNTVWGTSVPFGKPSGSVRRRSRTWKIARRLPDEVPFLIAQSQFWIVKNATKSCRNYPRSFQYLDKQQNTTGWANNRAKSTSFPRPFINKWTSEKTNASYINGTNANLRKQYIHEQADFVLTFSVGNHKKTSLPRPIAHPKIFFPLTTACDVFC